MIEILIILMILSIAHIDAEDVNEGNYIQDHTSRWIMRAIIFVVLCFLDWWTAVFYAVAFVGIFDHAFNLFRGHDFWRLGTTAKWDIFWQENKLLYKLCKIFLWGLMIFLIINKYV